MGFARYTEWALLVRLEEATSVYQLLQRPDKDSQHTRPYQPM